MYFEQQSLCLTVSSFTTISSLYSTGTNWQEGKEAAIYRTQNAY